MRAVKAGGANPNGRTAHTGAGARHPSGDVTGVPSPYSVSYSARGRNRAESGYFGDDARNRRTSHTEHPGHRFVRKLEAVLADPIVKAQ
jgi:hypothetical protein